MATTITENSKKITLTEVTDVNVSEIEEDSGTFIRRINIYGTPAGENIPPVLEIIIKSDTEENLNITTPVLNF